MHKVNWRKNYNVLGNNYLLLLSLKMVCFEISFFCIASSKQKKKSLYYNYSLQTNSKVWDKFKIQPEFFTSKLVQHFAEEQQHSRYAQNVIINAHTASIKSNWQICSLFFRVWLSNVACHISIYKHAKHALFTFHQQK